MPPDAVDEAIATARFALLAAAAQAFTPARATAGVPPTGGAASPLRVTRRKGGGYGFQTVY